jgi:hypothetical protein
LDEGVDRFRVQVSGQWPVALADWAQHRALADSGGIEPGAQRSDRAAGGVASAGEHDQLRVDAVLIGLGSGQREHQTVGVLGDLVDGQRG